MVASSSPVWVHGVSGRMGSLVRQAIEQSEGVTFAGGSDHKMYDRNFRESGEANVNALAESLQAVDILIDFSTIEANAILIDALKQVPNLKKPAVLVATTGLSGSQLEEWRQMEGTQVLVAPNTSLGIMILAQLTKQLAKFLPGKKFDLEIVETHHRHKVDAPSGTALFLAEAAVESNSELQKNCQRQGKRKDMEVGVHAVRGGNVFGEHEVRFLGEQEEVYLGHRAFSRELFAFGALTMAQWLVKQPDGLYSVFDVDLLS